MNPSFSASHLILAAVALTVGLALGGMGPRGETRDLRTRIAELEAQSDQRRCDSAGSRMGEQIASALRANRSPTAPSSTPAGVPEPPVHPPPTAASPDPQAATEGAGTAEVVRVGEPDSDAAGRERLGEVMDALDLRRTQARQALIEQAHLSDAQLHEFDAVVDDMNADLSAIAGEFVATVRASGGEPDRRESMLFARDTIDVLLGSEEAMWGTLEADQRGSVDPAVTDPFSYVDGTVVEVLGELDRP